MEEIIKVDMRTPIEIALDIDAEGRTTAKKLYEFLELAPQNYARWVKSNITENSFATNGEDYYSSSMKSEGRGNFAEDYKLSATFAKKLAMKAGGERGEEVRDYYTRMEDKVKQKAIDIAQLSPQMNALYNMIETMARQEIEQKRQALELLEVKNEIAEVKAHQSTINTEYFSISGYASLRGIKVDTSRARMLGSLAGKLSRKYDYEIGKVYDAKYGAVNTYHIDILKEVFKGER